MSAPTRSAASPRRRAASHARAALAAAVLAFVLVQVGLRLFIERAAPGVRDVEYAEHLARLRRGGVPEPPQQVLMIGTSRTQFGLKAASLQRLLAERLGRPVSAHNYGQAGARPVNYLFIWERLRRDGIRPDLLLIEVFPAALNANRPDSPLSEEYLPTRRLDWTDLAFVESRGGDERPGLRRDWLLLWCFPWHTHRDELLRRSLPALEPFALRYPQGVNLGPAGDIPVDEDVITAAQKGKALGYAAVEYEARLGDFRLGGPGCAALCELLDDCRRDGVRVLLVLMPEGPVFRSWFPASIHQECLAWLQGLSRQYGAAVVDAQEWMEEDAFFDSHHMLPRGAERFTERLGREAVLPLLQSALRTKS